MSMAIEEEPNIIPYGSPLVNNILFKCWKFGGRPWRPLHTSWWARQQPQNRWNQNRYSDQSLITSQSVTSVVASQQNHFDFPFLLHTTFVLNVLWFVCKYTYHSHTFYNFSIHQNFIK